jgi:hypothetical protein
MFCFDHVVGFVFSPEPGDKLTTAFAQPAGIIYFDAYRILVKSDTSLIRTSAGMPGDGVKRDQLRHRTVSTDDQMRGGLNVRITQGAYRRLRRAPRRVVDDYAVRATGGKLGPPVGRILMLAISQ